MARSKPQPVFGESQIRWMMQVTWPDTGYVSHRMPERDLSWGEMCDLADAYIETYNLPRESVEIVALHRMEV